MNILSDTLILYTYIVLFLCNININIMEPGQHLKYSGPVVIFSNSSFFLYLQRFIFVLDFNNKPETNKQHQKNKTKPYHILFLAHLTPHKPVSYYPSGPRVTECNWRPNTITYNHIFLVRCQLNHHH